MPERVAPRLGPDGETVWLLARRDAPHLARGGVDHVDHVVVAAGQPELLAVGADIAHVRAAPARDDPGRLDLPCSKVDYGHAALAPPRPVHPRGPPVDGVELLRVPAGIQPVRADAGGDEADFGEGLAVHEEHAARL